MFENIKAKIKLKQISRNYPVNKDISYAIDSICENYKLVEITGLMKHFLVYTFINKKNTKKKIELAFWNSNKYYAWMSSGSISVIDENDKKIIFSWIDEMPEAKTMLKIKEMNNETIKDIIVNNI